MNSSLPPSPPGRCLTAAVLLAISMWTLPASASAADGSSEGLQGREQVQPIVVGKVTLALGKALIVDPAGLSQTVRTGSKIHAGDRIETAEGGHVHIRFVDGALVSVRPTSRLVVEDYQFDAQHVERSLVRFRLDHGVARAISGAAAEGARERFRLNTPLVAIGVRGTDFVVRTDAAQTLASVNQGAIVVAPFGAECQAQATGPCGTGSAKLLSASMGPMLVEYRDQFAQPEIRPVNGLAGNGGVALASSGSASGNGGSGNAASSSSSSSTTTVASRSSESLTLQSHKSVGVSDESVSAVLVQGAVHLAGEEIKKPTKPVEPGGGIVTPVPAAQLAWGRWSWAASQPGDVALSNAEAREGRSITVRNDDFILFRNETTASLLGPQLGTLGFSLQQSQAQFIAANGSRQAASVLGGSLSLDFAARQFNTLLQLTSGATGAVGLQAAGEITQQGYFYSHITGQSVTGAVALDAKSAGYSFEKSTAGGTLSGITLWGR